MNKSQAKLIAKIAHHIKDVAHVNAFVSYELRPKPRKFQPVCFFAEGRRAGYLTDSQAAALAHTNSCNRELSVTNAYSLIFSDRKPQTGRDYFNIARRFLTSHGFSYSQLIAEVKDDWGWGK